MDDLFDDLDKIINNLNQNIDDLEKKVAKIQNEADELIVDYEKKMKEYEEFKEYVNDNYKPIEPYEMYGVRESDFH